MAIGSSALLLLIVASHLRFPLSLEIMEGTILQHFQRASSWRHIYTEPTGEFVALAYNPLYYFVSIPAGWVFGQTLSTLRLVSVAAYALSAAILFRVAREKTSSVWAGLVTLGLFAAAYDVMDAYIDTAHSDACLLASVLLGTYLIDMNRSRLRNIAGVLVLVASFWFKQHGALFTAGGVLFLTWRDGIVRSWIYWVLASVLGPGLYLGLGPLLFGSHFHFFTLEVPSSWDVFDVSALRRVLWFVLISYPLLGIAAVGFALMAGNRAAHGEKAALTIWHVQLGAAILSAILGSLDPGSSNNVFIPMGTWLILMGSIAIFSLETGRRAMDRRAMPVLALLLSFAALLYDPRENISSFRAQENFDNFVAELRGLGGTVYAPSIGQLDSEFKLSPSAHWVALQDLVRGGRHMEENKRLIESILTDAAHPAGNAYLLTYKLPAEIPPELDFPMREYILEKDYGDRFKPLRVVPHRWSFGWPRYLFRYQPSPKVSKIAETTGAEDLSGSAVPVAQGDTASEAN
jgi:hypothetical protein